MRTIAISDIHGCYNELKKLLSVIEEKGVYNKEEDKLVFLGDYIDRGKDSRLVIELIRNLQKENNNVIALMGNHEDMLLQYNKGIDSYWMYNGGRTTLDSYEGFEEQFVDDVEWMKNLPLYYEDEHFIFVHAGVDLYKPIEEQEKETLLWTREPFIYGMKKYDKQIVFGHTPTITLNNADKPVYTISNNIDIDTGCVFGGSLSALIMEDGEIKGFHQVKKEKEVEKDYGFLIK